MGCTDLFNVSNAKYKKKVRKDALLANVPGHICILKVLNTDCLLVEYMLGNLGTHNGVRNQNMFQYCLW